MQVFVNKSDIVVWRFYCMGEKSSHALAPRSQKLRAHKHFFCMAKVIHVRY